jgi:hypothetical protein
LNIVRGFENGPDWVLKKYLYVRYCILILSVVAMDVKFGFTLREKQDTGYFGQRGNK